MNAVVVEIKNEYVIALSDNGVFTKVKNKNYGIGEVLVMKENTKNISKKIIISAASVAAIAMFSTVSAFAYYSPVGKVSLDVNPSIEYSINMFDKVIDVTGVNEDGQNLLGDVDLTGENIEDAISDTIDLLISSGYITDTESNDIVIATYDNDENDNEELAQKLEAAAEEQIEENNIVANVECVAIGRERVQQAKELGVTPGKLNLVEKLKESSKAPDEINTEEWLNKPVKEIQQEIKENNEISNKPENNANGSEDNSGNKPNNTENGNNPENPNNNNTPEDNGNKNSGMNNNEPAGEQIQEQTTQQTQEQIMSQEQVCEEEPIQSQEQIREDAFTENSSGNENNSSSDSDNSQASSSNGNNTSAGNTQSQTNKPAH